MKVTAAVPGALELDPDLKINILAPNSKEYEELNDYSVVLKITYLKTSFLLTGDAEKVSEEEMIKNKYDLKADVLKVGHHGSKSSTSKEFLNTVAPKYAVISVGKDNDYGLPNGATIERLATAKITTYRTDVDGTIVVKSDGKTVTFDKKPADAKTEAINEQPKAANEKIVYYTSGGKSYHYSKDCPTLSRSKKFWKVNCPMLSN